MDATTAHTDDAQNANATPVVDETKPASVADKGKAKQDIEMEEDEEEEDDDEEDDDEEEEDEDEEMEDNFDEIDPSAIRNRRTRGVRVDYTSAEALAKAGLTPEQLAAEEEHDHDVSFEASKDGIHVD